MEKNETAANKCHDTDAARRALKSAFPSEASFSDFKENDHELSRKAIPAILHYACVNRAIDGETETAFIDFLQISQPQETPPHPINNITFSDIIEHLAGNQSVNTLIAQLDKIARLLGLPAVSAPMVTRLKQHYTINTSRKRGLLRLLAFWLGFKHPALGWNYDFLLQLAKQAAEQPKPVTEKACVTISFNLKGLGDLISHSDVGWLKNELSDCMDYLNLSGLHKKMIETTGATSFLIRFPKNPGAPDEPMLYRQAIRQVLALAHQMSTRWLLYPGSSRRKRLMIIINAGLPENHQIEKGLPANIVECDSGIYLSDFAYLCAGVGGIKGFRQCVSSLNNDTAGTSIWSLAYFWPNYFYDYIPCLLEGYMLPPYKAGDAYDQFQNALRFPEANASSEFGAIEAMHRHPQHSLLFIEIAKVLRARQMIHEADEVISHLLLSDPDNLPARFMRILNQDQLATGDQDMASHALAFERGLAEGERTARHFYADTEIWWATGMVYFTRAIHMLRHLRFDHPSDPSSIHDDMIACLNKAADCFRRGLAASSVGYSDNGLFWLQYAQSFIELLSQNHEFFNKEIPLVLDDGQDAFQDISIRVMRKLGLLPSKVPETKAERQTEIEESLKTALFIFSKNVHTMIGRSYRPYRQHLYAMALWDFAPKFSLTVYKTVLALLEDARKNAAALVEHNLSVYRIFSGFIPAQQFGKHMERIITFLKTFIPEEDLAKGENFPPNQARLEQMSKVKLMLLEVDYF